MKSHCMAVLFTLLLFPLVSRADGNQLLEHCTHAERAIDTEEVINAFGIGACLGLAQGVRDTMFYLNEASSLKVCFPENGFTNGQAVRIVTSYLKKHPAALHKDEVLLTMIAFTEAYPCP